MKRVISHLCFILLIAVNMVFPVNRNGTTAANFLEIDLGSAGSSMGGAYVSLVSDMSAVYWNPAGLSAIRNRETLFLYQPWIVGIENVFAGIGFELPRIGTLAFSINYLDYGDEEVTTVDQPDGTGELYTANEYALGISYGRKIVNWFSFGVTAKYISSSIWHTSASAFALDLGVIVDTEFFSVTGDRHNGLKIGMSISNYGTRMKYDGMDLLNPIDITDDYGNFANVPGQFKTDGWELPLLFRIGVSIQPLYSSSQVLTLSIDALHPNNNSESINLGGQYEYRIPGGTSLFLRIGLKGTNKISFEELNFDSGENETITVENAQYGLTYGGGLKINLGRNQTMKIDYGFRTMGMLGNMHQYTLGYIF